MTPIIISVAALIVSAGSVVLARLAWQESNRPIVTAPIQTVDSGNLGTALKIVVANTGNRPAKDIRLHARESELSLYFQFKGSEGDGVTDAIRRCFSDRGLIPVLANGECAENAFGFLSVGAHESTWVSECLLAIQITYGDTGTSRRFSERMKLRIGENTSFARGIWKNTSRQA